MHNLYISILVGCERNLLLEILLQKNKVVVWTTDEPAPPSSNKVMDANMVK
jgi:hypothetical protein